jgi:hypothetical protein
MTVPTAFKDHPALVLRLSVDTPVRKGHLEDEHYSTGATGNKEKIPPMVEQLSTAETTLPRHNVVAGTTDKK